MAIYSRGKDQLGQNANKTLGLNFVALLGTHRKQFGNCGKKFRVLIGNILIKVN